MTEQPPERKSLEVVIALLNTEADRLFRKYNDLPEHTHARHIAGQLMGAARNYLDPATIENDSRAVELAQLWLDHVRVWFDLLDSYPEFQTQELEGMEGAFPEHSQGQGAQKYLEYAQKRLRGM